MTFKNGNRESWRTVTTIISRDETGGVGRVVGSPIRCTLEGCGSMKLAVRWPNGKLTWVCLKGMKQLNVATMQII